MGLRGHEGLLGLAGKACCAVAALTPNARVAYTSQCSASARMSNEFTRAASIDYPIIDADAHVYEPPDVRQGRVPGRLRERAPRVQRTDEGDVWVFNAGERVRPIGLMAAAGASYLDFRPSGLTYECIRPGCSVPAARHERGSRAGRTTPSPWDCVSSRLNRGGVGAWSLVFGCQSIAVGGARVTQDEAAAEGLDLTVARAESEIGFHARDEFAAADRQARTPLGHSAV